MGKACRGQAAIEFISTYGWAIMVIVIVLAALVWLGVFNVATRAPDRCTFQGGLQCESAKLRAGLRLTSLVVTSRLTEPIYICGLRCTNNPDKSLVSDVESCLEDGVKLRPGAQMDLVDAVGGTPYCSDYFAGTTATTKRYSVGDTYGGRIEIYYSTDYDSEDDRSRIFYGEISLKVQP